VNERMIKHLLGILLLLPLGLFGAQLTQIKTHIELTADPLVGLTTLIYSFNTLGYKLQIDSVSTQKSVSRIDALVIGLKPLNPVVLGDTLQENGIKLTYARMNQETMELGIDATAAVWNVPLLNPDEGVEMQRSNTPYWFRVEGGQMIRIEPAYGAKWYPDVSVMDASMHVLSTERSEKSVHELEFSLPEGAYYLKISNTNGMKALKEGMWVESMSPGR